MKAAKIISTFMLYLIISLHASGQSYSIEGNIVDTLDNGIELATVLLLQEKDSVMAGFSITNPKGKFKIDDVPGGTYILNATYLGFKDLNQKITISETQDLGRLPMKFTNQTLDDIVVSASHIPIRLKNDTVEYNAAAFKTRPADNVEELLKKLPGVEVEDDGTITAHGEEVENVFVDGKEFFGSDPTIATKNLPADVIDNVQVFDKKSDMAEFSGIDDGDRSKTINLVLKEGKKAGYFGNASLGYGTDERYDTKFNVNRFTKSTQLSAIGMLNNVNKQGFSFREYVDFMGGFGALNSGGGRSNNTGIPIASGLGKGFVNTAAGGLNYNIDVSKNLDINSSYFFNRIENDIHQEVSRQSLLTSGGFNTEQVADLLNTNKNHKINSKIEAKLDSTQKLITRVSLGWNDGNSLSQSTTNNLSEDGRTVSGGFYDNVVTGDRIDASINSTYMKKISKRGIFLTGNLTLGLQNRDDLSNLSSVNDRVFGGVVNSDSLKQEQIQSNHQKNYNFRMSFTVPLGNRKYLELNASRRNFINDFDKDFYDLFDDNELRRLNEELSNNYKRNYSYNKVGLNYKINKKKSSLTTGLSLQHSGLNGTLRDEGLALNQDYFYILPSLIYNNKINGAQNLTIRYSTSVNEPSLEQLQPLVDNSDPLNVYVGNPNLEPSYRHVLRINFNSFSQFSNVGFFGRLNASYTNNSITNTRVVDDFFVQTTRPVNTDYSFNSTLYFNLSAPLKFIKQKINVSNSFTFSENILFVNGSESLVKRINERVSLSFENWKTDIVEIEIGSRIGYNKTDYSNQPSFNQTYLNAEYFLDFNLDLKRDWNINTFIRHTAYSGEDFGDQTSLTRWQAAISKVFLPSKKLRAEFAVFDILNQNRNISRTSNLDYFQDERITSLGQYFMLTLSYSFSGFGSENSWGRGRGSRQRRR